MSTYIAVAVDDHGNVIAGLASRDVTKVEHWCSTEAPAARWLIAASAFRTIDTHKTKGAAK